MIRYDVAIVGGGPIGSYIANKVAKKGYKVVLLEEHKSIGEPLKCAGLITPRVFNFLDFSETKVTQNIIYGAHIHSPSGNLITIGGDKRHALVINRSKFDEEISNNAKNSGAEILLESKTLSCNKCNNTIRLNIKHRGKKKQLNSSILIGADGAYSMIRKTFNFPQPIEFLQGIGAEVVNINLDPKFVEIYLGKNIAPGFFAWAIPINKDGTKARIGLCVNRNLKNTLMQYFTHLLKLHQLKNIKISKYISGSIPLGPLKKTVNSNIMLVGDAAAQVKPTSGGGIYPGLTSARHCSSVALEALELNSFSNHVLNKYHRLWSKEIGRELSLGMKFRTIYKNLNDEQLDKYIKKFSNKKITDIVCKFGDIDYPSKLVFPLLKKSPSLIKFLPSAIKSKK